MPRVTGKRVVVLLVGILAALAVAPTARYAYVNASAWASYMSLVQGLDRLEHAPASGTTTDVVFDVPYRGVEFSIVVPVDTGYLEAARAVDGSALFGFNRSVRAAALRALVREQAGDPFVGALSNRLQVLKRQLNLSDDDYVDLITRAVQAIPYGTLHKSTFMPVVTANDDIGVCVDKTVLLTAILSHEGYDTGVWVFPTQAHVAAAVRGTGPGMRSTGYTLVETTRLSYVGEVARTLRGAGPVCEIPQLITLNHGSKRYTRDLETEFLAQALERAREPRSRAYAQLGESGNRLAAWIDSRRDWPDTAYAAVVATGAGR